MDFYVLSIFLSNSPSQSLSSSSSFFVNVSVLLSCMSVYRVHSWYP